MPEDFSKLNDEERLKAAQEKIKNTSTDYDAELLERILNRSVPDIGFISPGNSYSYDADQELMTIHIQQSSSPYVAVIQSTLLLKIQPDLNASSFLLLDEWI